MGATFYYWLTIASLLSTMLLFFRKDIPSLVSCATITLLYASGLYGSIFMQVFDFCDNYTSIDLLFLLVMVGIVYASWLAPKLLVKIFIEKCDVKSLACSLEKGLLMWCAIFMCVILYSRLYEVSTSLICTIFLCLLLAAKLSRRISSKETTDEETDDRYCTAFIFLIPCFFATKFFNSMIGDNEILMKNITIRLTRH